MSLPLRTWLALCLLPLMTSAQPAASVPPLRVLFLGNSLTEDHDLPAMVQAMAQLQGRQLTCIELTRPNYSLEDHWRRGSRLLEKKPCDVLVMQQGASTQHHEHLRVWTSQWADAARAQGAQPALFMVWPHAGVPDGFLLSSQAHRKAAQAGRTALYPEAWALALHAAPRLKLYAPDGLHATKAGSFLAAMVITRGLTGLDPDLVPARLTLGNRRVVTVNEADLEVFRTAVRRLDGPLKES